MSNVVRADTDQMRTTVQTMQQSSQVLQADFARARQAMRTLQNSPWSGQNRIMAEDYWQRLETRFNPSIETLTDLANRLLRTAEAYEEAARVFGNEGMATVSYGATPVLTPTPVPTPTPAPATDQEEKAENVSVRSLFDLVNDILTPIDWISDRSTASKHFHEIMQQVGRSMNGLLDTRGYIKKFDSLASFLEDSSQAVSTIGTLLDANDFRRYFNGEITNKAIARTAIDTLIPIPFLNDRIGDWAVKNMVDPDGKWQGLVPKAGG